MTEAFPSPLTCFSLRHMTLDDIDATGLIRESYNIDGITVQECRSIFLDWAIRLPVGQDDKVALDFLVATYGPVHPNHPMTQVLKDGLSRSGPAVRRGGRAARVAPQG
jgi:hypothetical protein